MNVFQNKLCNNSVSNNKAWVSRAKWDTPHHSEYACYLRSEVRFWEAHGLYWAYGLRLALFQNFHVTRRLSLSPNVLMELLFFHFVTCALDTGPLRAKDLQCVAVIFFFLWKTSISPPSPNTLVLGSKYVMFCIKCLFTWIGRDWGSERRTSWYLICRKEKIPALKAFHSLVWLEYIFVKKRKRLKTSTERISALTQTRHPGVWKPAAFSATQRDGGNTCGSISSTPKGWSFLHPLSCNPHCSLATLSNEGKSYSIWKKVLILNVWF